MYSRGVTGARRSSGVTARALLLRWLHAWRKRVPWGSGPLRRNALTASAGGSRNNLAEPSARSWKQDEAAYGPPYSWSWLPVVEYHGTCGPGLLSSRTAAARNPGRRGKPTALSVSRRRSPAAGSPQPGVLDALVVVRVAGVGGEAATAHHRVEPVRFDPRVVAGVVAGGHDGTDGRAGGGPVPQRVDPLDQTDDAGVGERLLATPAGGGEARELVTPRVLHVREVRGGELHEAGQGRTTLGAAAPGGGRLGAGVPLPAGAVAQPAVALPCRAGPRRSAGWCPRCRAAPLRARPVSRGRTAGGTRVPWPVRRAGRGLRVSRTGNARETEPGAEGAHTRGDQDVTAAEGGSGHGTRQGGFPPVGGAAAAPRCRSSPDRWHPGWPAVQRERNVRHPSLDMDRQSSRRSPASGSASDRTLLRCSSTAPALCRVGSRRIPRAHAMGRLGMLRAPAQVPAS